MYPFKVQIFQVQFPCLLQRESFLSSLLLVELELEPTLTWGLSEPKSGVYSGFKAFLTNLSYEYSEKLLISRLANYIHSIFYCAVYSSCLKVEKLTSSG